MSQNEADSSDDTSCVSNNVSATDADNVIQPGHDTEEYQETCEAGNEAIDIFERVSMIRPKVKSRVEFKENSEWKTAKVLSKQPKRTGSYKDYLNIHVENESEPRSLDWSTIKEWKEVDQVEEV